MTTKQTRKPAARATSKPAAKPVAVVAKGLNASNAPHTMRAASKPAKATKATKATKAKPVAREGFSAAKVLLECGVTNAKVGRALLRAHNVERTEKAIKAFFAARAKARAK